DGEGIERVREVRAGDNLIRTHLPIDVIHDFRARNRKSVHWRIIRWWASRWELAALAETPEDADTILNYHPPDDLPRLDSLRKSRRAEDKDSDFIPVDELYHAPTRAVPQGRCAWVVADTVLLKDGPNKYGGIPIFRNEPGKRFESDFSYATSHDAMG